MFRPHRSAWTPLLLVACAAGSHPRISMPVVVAHGRSELCPEGPVDPYANASPSPTARRCTYDDAIGSGATRLGGKVTGQGDGALPGPGLAEMVVTVHRVEDPAHAPGSGPEVARARTDAQGAFHLSAVLGPDTYDVVARTTQGGPRLAHVRLDLEGSRPRRVEDLRLEVPRDAALGPPNP